jgi:PPM family protein phosphatase
MHEYNTSLRINSLTDKGLERGNNEDFHSYSPHPEKEEWCFFQEHEIESLGSYGAVMIVADGMGGMNAGEVASQTAVEAIREFFNLNLKKQSFTETNHFRKFLEGCVDHAQEKILLHEKTYPETKGMGTTIVIAWVHQAHLYVCWCGDSRCYLWHDGKLTRISKDHSYVQQLVDGGLISQEQAFYHPENNIITRSLGSEESPPKPDFTASDLEAGDRVLVCTDGLCGMITDKEIISILEQEKDTQACSEKLIAAANKAGGHDNITAVLCDVIQTGAGYKKLKKGILRHGKKLLLFAGGLVVVVAVMLVLLLPKGAKSPEDETKMPNDTSALQTATQPGQADSPSVLPDTTAGREGSGTGTASQKEVSNSGKNGKEKTETAVPPKNNQVQPAASQTEEPAIGLKDIAGLNMLLKSIRDIFSNLTVSKGQEFDNLVVEAMNSTNDMLRENHVDSVSTQGLCDQLGQVRETARALVIIGPRDKFDADMAELEAFCNSHCKQK